MAAGGRRWRWRRGWRGQGRPPTPVYLGFIPRVHSYAPVPDRGLDPVRVTYPEVEALRLVDLEERSYDEAARLMGVSRATVWRLARSGRRKLIQAIVEGRPIVIEPGGVVEEDREGPDRG